MIGLAGDTEQTSTISELESLIEHLAGVARQRDGTGRVARQLDELRVVLASHVLAAYDLQEAGVPEAKRHALLETARRQALQGLDRLRGDLQH